MGTGTRSGRGPTRKPRQVTAASASPREVAVHNYLHRWAETAGARLLIVDPGEADPCLIDQMAGRGVHLTWAESTTDALIEYGRTDPHAVVVAPDSPGIPAAEFVAAVRARGATFVVAALGQQSRPGADVGSLMLAGASAVVDRPYAAEPLWQIINQAPRALDDHAHVSFGRVELDARSYQVAVDGRRIADLPLKEFELLRTLLLNAPEVVSDEELRVALWGDDVGIRRGNTMSMHVTRLRSRLEGIVTIRRVRGRGYALDSS